MGIDKVVAAANPVLEKNLGSESTGPSQSSNTGAQLKALAK